MFQCSGTTSVSVNNTWWSQAYVFVFFLPFYKEEIQSCDNSEKHTGEFKWLSMIAVSCPCCVKKMNRFFNCIYFFASGTSPSRSSTPPPRLVKRAPPAASDLCVSMGACISDAFDNHVHISELPWRQRGWIVFCSNFSSWNKSWMITPQKKKWLSFLSCIQAFSHLLPVWCHSNCAFFFFSSRPPAGFFRLRACGRKAKFDHAGSSVKGIWCETDVEQTKDRCCKKISRRLLPFLAQGRILDWGGLLQRRRLQMAPPGTINSWLIVCAFDF